MDERENILLINLALLGDAVFSSALISSAEKHRFTVCCTEESSEIFKMFRNVVQIIKLNKKSFGSFMNAIKTLSKLEFNYGINFTSSFRGRVLLQLSRVKKKFFTAQTKKKVNSYRGLLTN